MPETTAIADLIRQAYTRQDPDLLAGVLAEDVRWGDDDSPNRCRSRADVLRTLTGWATAGVTARVRDVDTGPGGVALSLAVTWPDPADRDRGEKFLHVFLVRDGKVREIRRYDDAASARAAIAAPPETR